MKTSAKKYAEALFEVLSGKTKKQSEKIIKKFIELLAKDNCLSQANKISDEFVRIWNKKSGLVETEIISASKLDNETFETLNNYLLKKTKKQKIESKKVVDENILGGVIIRYEDKILDGSLRKRLGDLKGQMIK